MKIDSQHKKCEVLKMEETDTNNFVWKYLPKVVEYY